MKYRVEVDAHDGLGWRVTKWGYDETSRAPGEFVSALTAKLGANRAREEFPTCSYRIVSDKGEVKRSHHGTPRKTARERAVYVINRGAMAEDIEKQIQLAVKAYAKRKANRK